MTQPGQTLQLVPVTPGQYGLVGGLTHFTHHHANTCPVAILYPEPVETLGNGGNPSSPHGKSWSSLTSPTQWVGRVQLKADSVGNTEGGSLTVYWIGHWRGFG